MGLHMTVNSLPPPRIPDLEAALGGLGCLVAWTSYPMLSGGMVNVCYLDIVLLLSDNSPGNNSFQRRRDYWAQAEIIIERLAECPGLGPITEVEIQVRTGYDHEGKLRVSMEM